jgi:ribosomal protein L11 methylase PrmA
MDTLKLILVALAALWMVYVLVDYLVPFFYGLPAKPTGHARIRKALKLAGLRPGETLIDLGCGDGRVLVLAAKEFRARAVGIDAGPVQVARAWINGQFNGVRSQVQVHWGNFLKADLAEADVVFAYLTSDYAPRL